MFVRIASILCIVIVCAGCDENVAATVPYRIHEVEELTREDLLKALEAQGTKVYAFEYEAETSGRLKIKIQHFENGMTSGWSASFFDQEAGANRYVLSVIRSDDGMDIAIKGKSKSMVTDNSYGGFVCAFNQNEIQSIGFSTVDELISNYDEVVVVYASLE